MTGCSSTVTASLIIIVCLINCCPQLLHASLLHGLDFEANLKLQTSSSKGQSPVVCSFDRNGLRDDFMCSTKTCFNTTSGSVVHHRVSCHRIKNRVVTLDEQTRQLIHVSMIPFNELRMIFKGAWKDWLGLQFLEWVYSKVKFY